MAKCYASKVIKVLQDEIGYLEKKSKKNLDDKTANAGYNNYTKYARDLDALGYFYNGPKNGHAYCDVTVDWAFVQAYGVEDALRLLCQPKKSYGAGVKYSRNYYKKKKQFYKKNPKRGDQIFFWKPNRIQLAHTGLVVKVDDTYVYTIEGNTSRNRGVVANGGGVWDKKYKLTYKLICGYGRPAYDEEPTTETETSAVPETIPVVSTPTPEPVSKKATDSAKNFLSSLAGTYKVTASSLNIRNGAGTSKKKMTAIPKGTEVKCYGYYNISGSRKWLYIQFTYKGVQYTGFASSKYLQKK